MAEFERQLLSHSPARQTHRPVASWSLHSSLGARTIFVSIWQQPTNAVVQSMLKARDTQTTT